MTDTEYETIRNAQIPAAERVANRESRYAPGSRSEAWNRVYHREMNRLTREALSNREPAPPRTTISHALDVRKGGAGDAGPCRIRGFESTPHGALTGIGRRAQRAQA
jgi:hypothetical protein